MKEPPSDIDIDFRRLIEIKDRIITELLVDYDTFDQ